MSNYLLGTSVAKVIEYWNDHRGGSSPKPKKSKGSRKDRPKPPTSPPKDKSEDIGSDGGKRRKVTPQLDATTKKPSGSKMIPVSAAAQSTPATGDFPEDEPWVTIVPGTRPPDIELYLSVPMTHIS